MTMFGTKGLITTLGRTWIQQYPADISRDGAAQIDPPASNSQGGDGQAGHNVVERIGAHKSGTVKGIHGVNAPGPNMGKPLETIGYRSEDITNNKITIICQIC